MSSLTSVDSVSASDPKSALALQRLVQADNFLFKSKREDSTLKVTDFGLSDFIKPGKKIKDIVGSVYFVAPEVLAMKSGLESDVWSIGIITYLLLCGKRPFWHKTDVGIFKEIMTLLPKLPHQPQLLQTVCLTIGAYSKWINAAPTKLSILPSLVDILTRGMSTSEDSSAAAAVAFKYICEDCKKQFSGSLDGLFHIYHIAVSDEGGYKISTEDCMHLVEALSAVITELPMDHA